MTIPNTTEEKRKANATLSSGYGSTIQLTIRFAPEKHLETWDGSLDADFSNLIEDLQERFRAYDWEKSKAIVEKRPAGSSKVKSLLKVPDDYPLRLSELHGATLRLMAPKLDALASLQAASSGAAAEQARRAAERAKGRARALTLRQQPTPEEGQFTFHAIQPLSHLPCPERSTAFLERLKADPGIRAAMRRHRFSVGLLTEMDPSQHTQVDHEGTMRTLGLNRNRGQVVELRLRTDKYDGFRDYKTIRKTLCHELAHNVHNDHDRIFWDLCHQIEREVEAADWKHGGRSVGHEEYAPAKSNKEDFVPDHGGWVGGTHVLGGRGSTSDEGLSRREAIARATEERLNGLDKAKQGGDTAPEGG